MTTRPPMKVELEPTEAAALEAKQKHWAFIREQVREREAIEIPGRPRVRSISDYPKGRFENLQREIGFSGSPQIGLNLSRKRISLLRLFARTKNPSHRKNFFTDGGSIPRLFRWSDDLDPFGSLPPYLLHDWEFDLPSL